MLMNIFSTLLKKDNKKGCKNTAAILVDYLRAISNTFYSNCCPAYSLRREYVGIDNGFEHSLLCNRNLKENYAAWIWM